MSYDIRCEDLARIFLDDGEGPYTTEQLAELSQTIQTAIEDWLRMNRDKP
jgi:hypothetical protein